MKIRLNARLLLGLMLAINASAPAQTSAGCGAGGYRVVARRWDALLKVGWEMRQDCTHPEWPARSVATASLGTNGSIGPSQVVREVVPTAQTLVVRAGDSVRLWQQDETVRIEMSGIVERSARGGERVMVRVTRQGGDEGLTVQRISGIVRGAGDVEMER